ncbi:putative uncharacterized protein [Candidatus Colimorpha enterica]|uniref:Dockerin domain-containing protein n=1 Tax=Candidatus Colimorpha enterica TaxID=3083063 RepID=R6U5L1_9BACT|nr:putative uncharacterized protein [Candidatus Colimorpha enterica]
MKHKVSKQILSTLLALVMVIGLIPASALTAFAASPTEITELSLSFITPSEIPAVGEPIKYMSGGRLTEGDDRVELTGNILLWRIDDSSVVINQTYDDIGMYYEAGRTYNAEIVVKVLDPEQYTIGENTKITLTNPGDFTYTSELVSIIDTGSSFFAYMKLIITMNGARTYPDIAKVVFKDLVSPTEGMTVTESSTDIYYNNCQMTSGIWLGNVWGKDEFDHNTFVAGETYTYRVVLTARDGYQFYENATIQLTSGGVVKAPSYYAYTNDNKTLTLDYTYTIPSVTWVDHVEATIKRYEQTLTPIAGEGAVELFSNTLEVDENAPYEIVSEMGRAWYSEDGTKLTHNDLFEAGKTYYFEYAYTIKNENRHLYRFVPENLTTTITGESYTGKGFQKAERVEYSNNDNTYVRFRYYFTAQFPAGVGSSAENPAMCYSYEGFKYAMENDNIRYVALGNVEDTLPLVSMEETGPYADNRWPGIWVNSYKDLILLGNAQFTAPNAEENVHRVYDHLIQVRQGGRLAISGSGGLTFHGNAVGWPTSVAEVVDGGILTINSGTVKGDTENRTSFCYGVNVNGGTLYVNDGTVIGTNRHNQAPISAVNLYDGTAYIYGGTFYSDVSDGAAGSNHYGLSIDEGGTGYLSGGTFAGISMPYDSDMSDYVGNGYTMTVNGINTTPASCSTTTNIVEIFKEISAVDIHVNAPEAGKAPAMYPGDVYMVPEGVTALAPVWYENNSPWKISNGAERFEAGKTYKVEIVLTADEGMNFAKSLTSATINYKNAEVSAFAGNWEKGIVLTVDFGECPETISDVELNVTAPKEGNTISYSVTDSSDAYGALGSGNTITNYRAWYVSNDGSNYTRMSQGDKFVAGKYYKFSTWVRTADGYEFPLYDNGVSIVPKVSATVNGYYANVKKAYDQDPARVIVVEYNFGMCNDDVVENITITNIDAPVAGQTPDYTANCFGTGYSMAGTNSGNWKVNGIVWLRDGNIYTGSIMDNTEKFQPGHEYTVMIDLVADYGYTFLFNHGNSIYAAAAINGNTAQINIDRCSTTEYQVWYTFTCSQAVLSAVEVSGIDAPVAGQTPDYTGTVGNATLYGFANYGYNAAGFWWYDSEDNPLTSEDKFVAGETYKLEIKLTSAMIDQVVASRFKTPVTATLNGKAVDSSDVMANSSTVYIYQTYTCKENSAVFVSGSVTSFNDASGDITLQLIPEGFSDPAYETIVTGNTVDYYFAGVAAGTYTLKVSKNNHVTREYTVVVGNSSVIQDVKIQLKGDVDGNGTVTTMDAMRANSHARGVTLLTDYALKCADVVGTDGTVTTMDAMRINAHAKGSNLLW